MRTILLLTLSFLWVSTFAQNDLDKQLNDRGEIVVSIKTNDISKIKNIQQYSIDKTTTDTTILYLNQKQYNTLQQLAIKMELQPIPSMLNEITMANSAKQMDNWDSYPDYETYLEMMENFAASFPDICTLDTIGYSIDNRIILALKISDNVNENENEPNFLYSSSIHGDELTGYVLMLRLSDYLLNNYNSDQGITTLINNVQLYINPLANPDGTFAGGNQSVYGATRGNANYVDLNRNFPDPKYGDNPDGNEYQKETNEMIAYMSKRNFNLSMNFHGGAEVVNYPWDTWSKTHADNDWFYFVSREYADTVHKFNSSYMTFLDDGVTNGYAWYSVAGGRQDYVTYFLKGREITTELSDIKLISASELPNMWNYNKESLINFMKQAQYGINGTVMDTLGNPIKAKIEISNYDIDDSQLLTDQNGKFYRYLIEGSYSLMITAENYDTLKVNEIRCYNYKTTIRDFVLREPYVEDTTITNINNTTIESAFKLFPNPSTNAITISANTNNNDNWSLDIYSVDGKLIRSQSNIIGKYLKIEDLKKGTYIFITSTKNSSSKHKIIIL